MLLLATLLSAAPPQLGVSSRDGAITAGAAAGWAALALLEPSLVPAHCRWCDRDEAGLDTLSGFDRWGTGAIWSHRHAAEVASNVLIGAIPVGVFASEWALAAPQGTRRQLGEDLLVVAEAGAVQGLVNEVVKVLVARERPYAHLGLEPDSGGSDEVVSFYSGHTSTAFALVAAAGAVASSRHYPHAGVIWAVGFPVAATVGYLRIAAGKHYLTDVLVGAAAGTVIGFGLPLLLHPGAVPNGPVPPGAERLGPAVRTDERTPRPLVFTFGGQF